MTPHIYPRQCAFKSIEDIKDKKVTIMGLGLNGGGEAAVRFFLKKGAYVTVTDMKTEEQLKATIDRLNSDSNLDLSRLLKQTSAFSCVLQNARLLLLQEVKANHLLSAQFTTDLKKRALMHSLEETLPSARLPSLMKSAETLRL